MSQSHRLLPAALWVAFAACIATRGAYVLYNGPLDHLFSDPARHWENGWYFFAPKTMGSMDPFGYQLWLRALQWVSRGTRYGVLAGTAVLSMALPILWFKALRELLPAAWALAGAVVIGFTPSLFSIYSYFMNETLVLVLSACGFWLTLRAMRTRGMPTLAALAIVWAFAAYTRIVALPLAGLCFFAVATTLPWRRMALFAAAIATCFGALAYPGCWHSNANLNFCAPFGVGYLNAIYRASGARTIKMSVATKGEYEFTSPSMSTRPLEPLSDWRSSRSGTVAMAIDPAGGRRDWETSVRVLRDFNPGMSWAQDKAENALMLMFDPSWPDTDRSAVWGWLNYWNRWLWLPLTVGLLVLVAKVRPTLRDALLPVCGLVLIALLLVQTNAVMEGRYRKPAEPLLIAGAFVMLHRLRLARSRRAGSGAFASQAGSRNGKAASPHRNDTAIIPTKIWFTSNHSTM